MGEIGLRDLITEVGSKAGYMGNKAMAGHKTTDIEDARLEGHRHPDRDIWRGVVGDRLVSIKHKFILNGPSRSASCKIYQAGWIRADFFASLLIKFYLNRR